MFAINTAQIKKVTALVILLSGSLLSTSTFAAGDANNGEKLSQTCMGCHGAPGIRNANPVFEVPMLGGQSAEYLVAALNGYKDKSRSHGTMQAQAASLSDQDMQDIAAYFSSIKNNTRPGHNAERAAKGKEKIAVCIACHGENGLGLAPNYPILAGQYASYLENALKDYRSGKRVNPFMSGNAATLSIEDIRDIAAWYSSQQDGVSAPEIQIRK